jgi:hypothetical protein
MTISTTIKNVSLSIKTLLSFMPLIADCHRDDYSYADCRYADCRGTFQLALVSNILKYQ